MIKASSMTYAIFIFLIIGFCCFTLIMVGSTSNYLSQSYYAQRELLYTSDDALEHYLAAMQDNEITSEPLDVVGNGMMSSATVQFWGCFRILKIATFFKNDTVFSKVLVGQSFENKRPALYLAGTEKRLSLAGEATIKGDIFTPQAKIESGYLNRKSFTGLNISGGTVKNSSRFLPELNEISFPDIYKEAIDLDSVSPGTLIYNDFKNKPLKVFTSKTHLSGIELKGNIVLVANDSLLINSNCKLENILIKAPKVIFQNGFVGSLQVFAKTKIVLEENVRLNYPSVLYVSEMGDEKVDVILKGSTRLEGGIIIKGEKYVGESKRLLKIEKKSVVIGDIYCNGSVDLKGQVEGSLFTDNFYLKTSAGNYTNYINEGKISSQDLPEAFLGPLNFSTGSFKNTKHETVKIL